MIPAPGLQTLFACDWKLSTAGQFASDARVITGVWPRGLARPTIAQPVCRKNGLRPAILKCYYVAALVHRRHLRAKVRPSAPFPALPVAALLIRLSPRF